jgi:hypothetical protein
MPTLDKLVTDRREAGRARAFPRRANRPGRVLPDVRREPVGNFAGYVAPDDLVGTFANRPHPRRRPTGSFAGGEPDRRREGSFGDHDLGKAA